ncbi:MAG: hypothetical protein H7Y20_00190, partial [Bryobacteraceae bacterium]|nr:hypothetical protein [Bryobacteraceae bacterium]
QNALKHGLASHQVVLPYEDVALYNALKASFTATYHPGSAVEVEFLDRMVDSWWRLERANRVEAQFLNQREKAISAEQPDIAGDTALAFMFSDPKETARMRLLMRYVASADKAWSRSVSDFEKAQKDRRAIERVLARYGDWDEPAAASPAVTPANGFVPQPEEIALPATDHASQSAPLQAAA